MAKARKKKKAKRAAKKRRPIKSKARKPVRRKARRAKAKKPASFIDAVTGMVTETRALRDRLAGHETFED
jgi:hypothetical protein